jgi:hypothetical protein
MRAAVETQISLKDGRMPICEYAEESFLPTYVTGCGANVMGVKLRELCGKRLWKAGS